MKTIDVNSEGLQYGYGVFETILVKNNTLIYFSDHYKRLKESLKYLEIHFDKTENELRDMAKKFIGDNNKKSVLKISCHKNSDEVEIVFSKRDFPYSENVYNKGYDLVISNNKRHSLNPIYKIKSTNFINNYLEMKTIKKDGFNEAIHLNEKDNITECIYSNIFFIKDNTLFTPDIKTGILPGIMREKIIEIAKKIDITVDIGYYSVDDIINSESVFLTSSLLGIMKVKNIDGKSILNKVDVINRLEKEIFNELP